MATFYSNENFPLPVVSELRRLGHDVMTVLESGKAGVAVPDEEVLHFATSLKRILLTLNRRHFIRLHDEFPQHAGIITCTFDPDFCGQAQRIHAAVHGLQETKGHLIRIVRPQR